MSAPYARTILVRQSDQLEILRSALLPPTTLLPPLINTRTMAFHRCMKEEYALFNVGIMNILLCPAAYGPVALHMPLLILLYFLLLGRCVSKLQSCSFPFLVFPTIFVTTELWIMCCLCTPSTLLSVRSRRFPTSMAMPQQAI